MVCNSCGRDNKNENANFCEYCGESFREGNVQKTEPTYNSNQGGTENASVIQPPMPSQAIDINKDKKPVSFLNWLGTYAIMLIPLVGGLVFFVMLIVWSFSSNTPESKKNWARATLVFMIILLIIALLFILMFVGMMRNPLFQEIFQDSYNEEMNKFNDIFRDFSY